MPERGVSNLNDSPEQTGLIARCTGCGAPLKLDRAYGLCPACVWSLLLESPEFQHAAGIEAAESELKRQQLAGVRPGWAVSDRPREGAPGFTRGSSLFPIPGHVVLQEIARGGMGIVYRARQLEPDRTVALKMLLPHQLGSVEMLERFRTEVRTVASLEHPGILPIYQVGEHDGLPYFTMKLAAPGTLASRMAQFRGRFHQIGELMANLADAVHYAHERGVLHRDLKPGNILFDEGGRPYVSDFGLAKFTDFADGESSALTRSIQLLGTPQFLPPEVAAGGVSRATMAGDLYSLGAILYELLTGRPPFTGEGLSALLKNIVEEPPTRPSRLTASVPHDLEVICLKCLAKQPADRYGAARELAEDLRRWLSGRPILARPISIPARVGHWMRRNPALGTVSVLLGLAVLCAIILQVRGTRDLRRALTEQRGALQQSLSAQAALRRTSQSIGQRLDTLELVQKATALGLESAPESLQVSLRTELAGALALPDLRTKARWPVHVAHFEASAEFSPDLSKYVCAADQGGAAVYDTASRSNLFRLPGNPEDPAISFRFSPDTKWLGVGFQDGRVELHALNSRHDPLVFPGETALRTSFEFLPDNRRVILSDRQDGVSLADYQDGTRRSLLPPPAVGFAMAPDPTGELVALQVGYALELVRIGNGTTVWSLPLTAGARAIAWSPDGRRLAVAKGEPLYDIVVLDALDAKVLFSFHDHDTGIGRLLFHPDGHSLISTSWGGRLVWRELAENGFRLLSDAGPRLLQFSPDGTQLVYEPSHGEAGIYEVLQASVFRQWKQQTPAGEEAFMMALSPDGSIAATSSARSICLWDVAAGKELSSILLPSRAWFVQLLFRPDGKSLLYSAIGLGIHEVGLVSRNQAGHGQAMGFGTDRKLDADNECIALEFAPDGKSLIVGENKQNAKNEQRSPDIWLWGDGDPGRARKLAGDWPLVGYHMTSDSRWGLTSHITEPDVTVWDPATGQRIRNLGLAEPVIFELTPDCHWLLASLRQAYQLIEIGSWKLGARWPADLGQQHYRCCAFSGDSTMVATAIPNGRVELRTLPEARQLIVLPSPNATQLKAIGFTPQKNRVITMTATGAVQDWNLAELRHALAAAGLDWPGTKNSK